ncbi:MAG TPA: hypothetical protein VN611_08560 [Patescibacteria group bacterium]|nr:hypothetical protein [Patescibacteria group bacterium]
MEKAIGSHQELMAVCSLHQKLFDLGAFTLGPERDIRVSRYANGSTGLQEWLLRFKGQCIRMPAEASYQARNMFPGMSARCIRETVTGKEKMREFTGVFWR